MVLTLARFAHYLAASLLFGAVLFPYYGIAGPSGETLRNPAWYRPLLLSAASAALIGGLAWFGLSGGNAEGNSYAGPVWAVRLFVAAGLVVLLFRKRRAPNDVLLLSGSFVLLVSIPWIGLAASGGGVAAPVRAFHLVAAGVWTGALFMFAGFTIQSSRRRDVASLRALHDALAHFSGAGTAVVATLALTGVFLFAVEGTSNLYMLVLIAKLLLFAAMLCLAAANRYWLTPRLSAALDSGADLPEAVARLRLSVLTETALAVLILAAVALLGVV